MRDLWLALEAPDALLLIARHLTDRHVITKRSLCTGPSHARISGAIRLTFRPVQTIAAAGSSCLSQRVKKNVTGNAPRLARIVEGVRCGQFRK